MSAASTSLLEEPPMRNVTVACMFNSNCEEITSLAPNPSDLSMSEPKMSKSMVPAIGMIFDTDEKAYHFYCQYAKEIGFGVRKHIVRRRVSGLVYLRVFCCYREGFTQTVRPTKKPRTDARTNCHAHLTVRLLDDGKYQVHEFEPAHNHDLLYKASDKLTKSKNVASKVLVRPLAPHVLDRKVVPSQDAARIYDSFNDHSVPEFGMEFENDEQAYQFYVNYAESVGFSARKHQIRRRSSGVVYSRTFVCHKEGFRQKGEEEEFRRPKPYDRTGCLASMTVVIMKNGRFRVVKFEPNHNHPLDIPSKEATVKKRWRRRTAAILNGSDKIRKDSASVQGNHGSPECTGCNCKNYIPSKRSKAVEFGDLGGLMQYFQEKQIQDPSFYYALQLDQNDQLANVFWMDGKSVTDFMCFGDVVCFDTTRRSCDRPLALFTGVNHHKQVIIFASVLVYDGSKGSWIWLLETFRSAMHGKVPKLILTEWCVSSSEAVAAVWPGVVHRFCIRQIHADAVNHLSSIFHGSVTFVKDFSRCLYDCQDEDDFVSGWSGMLENYDLFENDWLSKLYQDRKNWALAYGRETFSADISLTSLKDSINDMIDDCFSQDLDFLSFIKRYDEIIDKRRQMELDADLMDQCSLHFPVSWMLKQAASIYTPSLFKVFQMEFEMSMDCMVFTISRSETICEYKVTADRSKEYIVRFDPSGCSITCSCKKFEFSGIQCRHVLKTFDFENIKVLPLQYVVKRWTKDAKVMIPRENCVSVQTTSCLELSGARRYASLCQMFDRIASRAAESIETFKLVQKFAEQLTEIDQMLYKKPFRDQNET